MQTCVLADSRVDIDLQATREWYAKAAPWGCSCGHCRNFLRLAQSGALPAFVLDILATLGIPPEKATYVCEICPDGDGHLYELSYRIAGTILSQAPDGTASTVRCCHEPYPYGAPGFPEPHFDLEFWLTLPWMPEEASDP